MPRKLPGEAAIWAQATPKVFERGRAYSRDGSVSGLVIRGDTITAAVAGILESLGREALADLILRRTAIDPDLTGWIEGDLVSPLHPGGGRRDDDWDGYRPRGGDAEVVTLVEKGWPFLEAGDGRNALRILEAVAGPPVEERLETATRRTRRPTCCSRISGT